jgi:hypothetical protein
LKIAYVCFLPNLISGVSKRYENMAQLSKTTSLDFSYILLNNTQDLQKDNFILKKMAPLDLPLSLKTQQKLFTHALIEKNVDFTLYDFIILRYPGSCSLTAISFYKKYGNKLITEHHTNEDIEYQLYKNGFINSIKFSLEPFCARRVFKHLAGIIGVTQEIVDLELQKSGPKPSLTLCNGIDVHKYPAYEKPSFTDTLELILVASNDMPWHGVDRVIEGILNYTGNHKIILNLVGEFDKQKYNYPFIKIHGTLQGDELSAVFNRSHFAIATLALHRKKMFAASPLKTREYMARGIPFIYAYEDDDINEDAVFTMKTAADDTPLDIYAMIQFLKTCEIPAQTVREYAKKFVDWREKFILLEKFLNNLYDTREKD